MVTIQPGRLTEESEIYQLPICVYINFDSVLTFGNIHPPLRGLIDLNLGPVIKQTSIS